MIIGIDASKAAEEKRTGVENFVYQLILHLNEIDHTNFYYLYSNKRLPEELLDNTHFSEIYIPFPKFWNKLRLPMALLKYKPDVYLQPSYMIPAFAPKKTIGVIHDLAWVKFPDAYSKTDLLSQKITLKNLVEGAAKLVCVSKSAANDLIEYMPSAKAKVEVIYLGAESKTEEITGQKDSLELKSKYFVSIGRLEERKNISNIIEAFKQFKAKGHSHKLVLAGKPGFGYDKIESSIKSSGYSSDIILPGFIPASEFNNLLKNAEALLYPSLYEGFGLTALEAMKAGAPVITSNVSSLPEVVGDAAILVDPVSAQEIAVAMELIVEDQDLRASLVKKGLKQAEKFSWEKTAKEYLKLMEGM